MLLRSCAALALGTAVCFAQLTADQKISDFQQMVGLFAKGYGPHEWKKQAFRIDLFDTARWLDRVRATRNDLDFYDVMSAWVAGLDDAHAYYIAPSNFAATLNFSVDIYEGRLLVDSVDRNRLSVSQYPIALGYELVSIDGEDANRMLDRMLRYGVAANPRSTRRWSASFLTVRQQALMPAFNRAPETATVVFRRFDGQLETYRIPWMTFGTPMESVGKFPALSARRDSGDEPATDLLPHNPLERLLNFRLAREVSAVVAFGATAPVFARSMPSTFVQRLGRSSQDPFYSGVFEASGQRIGFIRIPTFGPSDPNGALTLFAREIAFFQENTDGLIVDVMRNGGGSASYTNALLNYLMWYPWQTMGVEYRATSTWIRDISSVIQQLRGLGAPAQVLRGYEDGLEAMQEANRTERGLTRPLPWDFNAGLDREPLRDQRGNLLAYTKPLMLLTDEFSASAADAFAALIQDNGRGPLFGWRTMGAGGNIVGFTVGAYSNATVGLTQSLMSRQWERAEEGGYPVSRYVENVGVHPDIQVDYMTRENLFNNGKLFVNRFVEAMVDHILKSR